MPIPRASLEAQSLSGLFKTPAAQGLDVARAELDLVRAEAAGALKLYLPGLVICAACFAVAVATVVIVALAAALALQRYYNVPALAHLSTGWAMPLLTILLACPGVNVITRKFRPVGTISKWLTGQINAS